MYAQKGKIILVTGVTGNQGGAVARRLLADGWRVRGLTRDSAKPAARELALTGIEIVDGNLEDRATIDAVLDDVYGVFAVFTPAESGVEGEIRQGRTLADASKAAGVRHYVYSSVAAANQKTGIPHFESKLEIEKHVKALGLPATVLRPVFFMYNFNSPMVKPSILKGTLSLALRPGKRMQMLAVEDLAAFVSMAFENPGEYIGKEIDLAGDEMTMPEAAEFFTRALGRLVSYREMPIEELRRGYSEDFARMFEWFNEKGYSVDINAVRAMHPGLMTLEQWLIKAGWGKAELKAA